jgi:hypothetical protein
VIARLAELFAPWQALYGDSKWLPIAMTSLHLLAMLIGGGLAIAVDRNTLRFCKHPPDDCDKHVREMAKSHRPIVIAMWVMLLTGIAMSASDIETFAVSPVYWVKLGHVALLVLNGGALLKAERAVRVAGIAEDNPDRPGLQRQARVWTTLRVTAVMSLLLWSATLIVGVMLVNVA